MFKANLASFLAFQHYNCDDKILRNHCIDLNALLSESSSNASATECQHGNESTQSIDSDIEELNLFTELKTFARVVPENATALQSLRYILKFRLDGAFPNVTTAHILLTVPVTVASAERNFSKLTLIKPYLRLSMTLTQDRLVGLAQISIENEIASSLDYATFIDQFASIKARKINLL